MTTPLYTPITEPCRSSMAYTGIFDHSSDGGQLLDSLMGHDRSISLDHQRISLKASTCRSCSLGVCDVVS